MKAFRLALLAAITLLFPVLIFSQTATTSLRGIVTDPSGAIIPGATVTIEDAQIGFTATRVSGAHGEYQFLQLQPGRYTVSAIAAGFGKQSVTANLLVSQPASINFKLTVQSSSVTMDVSATAETINTTDATIGNAVNNKTIEALPMEGRNVPDLLSLQPGVLYLGRVIDANADSRSGVVSGARSDQTNITLDGVDNNDQVNGTAFTGVLRSTLDSVQEFRVTTSNSNADSGRSSGAQVNLVTKSGTNSLHGALYEYNRSSLGQANNWFNKQAELNSGLPNRPGKLIRNTYGASLGGPIVKDKLFYFLNYEGQRTSENVQESRTVPTDLLRAGNIQYLHTDASGNTTNVLLDPSQIAGMDPNCSGNGTCPWGPGDDPYSLAVFQLYPHANGFNSGDGLNTGSFSFSAPNPAILGTYIAKIDYVMSDRSRFFWRGNLQNDKNSAPPEFPGQPASSTITNDTKGFALGHTWTITNDLVNNLRYAFIRQSTGQRGVGQGAYVDFRGFDPTQSESRSSFVKVPVNNVTDDISWTRHNHTFSFGANWRHINNDRSSDLNSYSSAIANAFWFNGAKIANSGGSLDPAAFGLPSVDPSFGTSYDFAMSALAGLVNEETDQYNYQVSKDGTTGTLLAPGAFVRRDFKSNEFEYYLQDSWRVKPNLTLTFGVRHTLLQTPYEANGQQVQPTIDLHNWFITRGEQAALGNSVQPDISFAPSGQARGKKPYWPMNKMDFAPRLAFAWSPSADEGLMHVLLGSAGKTSIRGGFGMYYDHFGEGIVNSFDQFGSFSLTSSVQNPASTLTPDTTPRFTGIHNLPGLNGTPLGDITYPATPSADPFGTGFAITYGLDDHIKTPYSEVVDFSIQRALPAGFTLETDYVGRFGRHMLQSIDLAQPLDLVDAKSGMDYYTAGTILSKAADQGATNVAPIPYFEDLFPDAAGSDVYGDGASGASATQNIYNLIWTGNRGNETGALYDMDIYCYPGCGGKTLRYWPGQYSSLYAWASVGSSSYNAAQFILRHPSSHGLQLDISYTYSKSMDMGSDAERNSTATNGSANNFGFILDAWNPRKNYAVSDFNTTHLLTVDWVYQLPFGQGRAVGGGVNRAIDAVIGGWQFSGLGRWSSGLPFSIYDGNGWSTNWEYESGMVQTGPVKMHKHLDSNGAPQAFADPSKALANMRMPYPGEAGQRNNFVGDGYLGIDAGLAKSWRTFRDQHLRFAWEVFNTTNSARFDTHSVDNGSTDGAMGVYSGLLTAPRVMQFSLRYDF
ncbi:MAG: TonB-dependent receptor [Acidobacteriaceae bacterium]